MHDNFRLSVKRIFFILTDSLPPDQIGFLVELFLNSLMGACRFGTYFQLSGEKGSNRKQKEKVPSFVRLSVLCAQMVGINFLMIFANTIFEPNPSLPRFFPVRFETSDSIPRNFNAELLIKIIAKFISGRMFVFFFFWCD